MKTFKEFILESTCNGSPKGLDCPIHGKNKCPKIKSHKSIEEIAKKHRLEPSFIKNQLKMGIPIEHEHTKNKELATDIALQHLDEIPDYYTRLNKMENSAKKEHKKFKDVKEERFSGDYSLHDWFSKSKSKDGKPGWVQMGGPHSGKPCARQPGQKSTPKCGSSKMYKSLSKKERQSAFERKNRQDPNQPQKSDAAKPTLVKTKVSEEKDACYYKVKSRYKVWPSAYASGALVKCRKKGSKNWGNKTKKIDESYTRIQSRGSTYTIFFNWRGKPLFVQMFFPQFTRPSKQQVTYEIRKVYPDAIVLSYNPSVKDPTKPLLFTGDENESRRY